MKKKFLTLIIILAVAIGVIALGSSLGWFPSYGGTGGDDPYKPQAIDYGDMEYTLVGGCDIRPVFTDENLVEYVAPGENMIHVQVPPESGDWAPSPLTINNKSTVTTNLRVQVKYSYWNGSALETVVYGDQTLDFTVDFPPGWVYNTTSKFWDYSPGGSVVIDAVDLDTIPEGIDILINAMGYDEEILIGSDYETRTVDVSLKVEAKQADYVDWLTVSP